MKYRNLDNTNNLKSLRELRQWRKERKAKQKDLSWSVPQSEVKETRFLQSNRTHDTITWIGHSTFLIQYRGLNIVTDPVWAERMGFFRRLSAPGLALSEMPPVDVVVISHNHYDHLDFWTLRRLNGSPLYLVPAGLRGKMLRKGFARVEELEWWQRSTVGDVEFHFVPANHWSRRTPWDTNASHWGGWVIRAAEPAETSSGKERARGAVYFAGDSGYFRGFKEIGERFGISFALMPIGAYEPEWFMAPQHVSPEEAVQAFLDCGGEVFVPMHYGAFRLADDTPKEALDRLTAEWERRGLEQERLRVLRLGETLRCAETRAGVAGE